MCSLQYFAIKVNLGVPFLAVSLFNVLSLGHPSCIAWAVLFSASLGRNCLNIYFEPHFF